MADEPPIHYGDHVERLVGLRIHDLCPPPVRRLA
jgi:hypothetical protein